MTLPRLHYTRVARTSGGSTPAAQLDSLATALSGAGWNIEVGTSSFADMIACRPPNSGSGADVQDMRIVFSTNSSALTRQMLAPDTYLANALHVGVAKGVNSALESGSTGGNPFDTGTFSGFWRTASSLNNERFRTIGVSDETLCVMIDSNSDSANCNPCFVGAIIESQDPDYAESNGRLVGMATSQISPLSTWLQVATGTQSWLTNGSTNGNSHFGYFEPGTSNWIVLDRWVGSGDNGMTLAPSGSMAHPSGKRVLVPIAVCHQSARTDSPLGYLRGMLYWKNDTLGNITFHDTVGSGNPGDFEDAVLAVGMNPHDTTQAVGLVMKDLRGAP